MRAGPCGSIDEVTSSRCTSTRSEGRTRVVRAWVMTTGGVRLSTRLPSSSWTSSSACAWVPARARRKQSTATGSWAAS
ncbi:hypothetical protein G7085_20205 [Tessaracoccus sp. HDW20]|nr:hypothetical protein [Tessaracoccus coleopterorum]